MSEPPPITPARGSPVYVRLLLLFAAAVALWTWKLLEPKPLPDRMAEELNPDLTFWAAKLLHAGVYAFLTVFGRWVFASPAGRRAVVGLLAAHGAGTELGQYVMDVGRCGCVRDVLIDWAGIAGGLVAGRWWATRAG